MFIVHGGWFRRNMRWLLAIVLALLIPSFIALYTNVDTSRRRELPIPTIDGEPVNPLEYQNARTTVIDEALLSRGGQLPQTTEFAQYIQQQTLLRVLMLQEAEGLGIQVDDEALVTHIRRQPFLRNAQGQFDPNRYREFIVGLNASRISETRFENVMRQQLIIQQLQNLIVTTAKVTPQQVKDAFVILNESVVVDYAVVTIDDQGTDLAVTDAELEAYYHQNQETYRTSRQAKVRYTFVPIEPQAQTVSDEDVATFYERSRDRFPDRSLDEVREEIRADLVQARALYAAGDRATELTVKLVPDNSGKSPEFAAIARAAGLEVIETGSFAVGDDIDGIPTETTPQFIQTALALSAASPVSDPLETETGFYVLELITEQPSEIPALATIKPAVVADLQRARASQAAIDRARAMADKIRAAVADGKTFSETARAEGLEPVTSAAFRPSDTTPDLPGAPLVKERMLSMAVGQVSEFLRTPDGGVIFTVKERTPPSDDEFAAEQDRTRRLLEQQQRSAVWQAWTRDLIQRRQVSL